MSDDSEKPSSSNDALDTFAEGATSEQEMTRDPLIGTLIDNKYEILSQLGGGGMGMVYTARHALMNRTVAIKVLRPHLGGNQEDQFFKRFLREAQTSSQLSHPNCITIFDFGIDKDHPFLVMELLPGRSLKQLLQAEAPLKPDRVLKLLSQICAGMEEAHRLGIIHRDLKPDNIIVTEKTQGLEQAVVLDFGIAKIVGAGAEQTSMTQTGGIIGTPQYMAPEQVLGKELDARCDVYALGVILYEMLSGEVPFEADSAMALMMKHLSEEPVALRTLNADLKIPQAVDAVLDVVLRKDPEQRYESVKDFRLALTDGLQSSPISETKTTSTQKEKNSWLLYLGAVAAVLLLGVGTLFLPASEQVPTKIATSEKVEETSVPSVDAEATLRRAKEHFDSGDFVRATTLLKGVLTENESANTHRLLARCYQGLQKPESAVKHFSRTLDFDPNDAATRYSLSVLFAENGSISKAKDQLHRAILLRPLLRFKARQEAAFQTPAFERLL